MLRLYDYDRTQTVRRKGGKSGRVVTPLDVEILGVIAAVIGVLAEAARKPAAMRECTHIPIAKKRTTPRLGSEQRELTNADALLRGK